MRYILIRFTFNEFGQEVRGSLRLLHAVAFHDLSVSVDADVPRPARLGLSVQDGRVGDVVVLEHTLLKLTLGCEVFLKDEAETESATSGQRRRITHLERLPFFLYLFYYLYIYSPVPPAQLGMGGNGAHISS